MAGLYTKALGQPGGCASYDIGGNAVKTRVPATGQEVAYSVTGASKWTAPSVVTPDETSQLASSYQFNSFLGLTQETGPNGATTAFSYDGLARPASTTNAYGGVTTMTYSENGRVIAAAGPGAHTLTIRDGLGQTVQMEKGDATGWKTRQVTEYGAGACSPMGKVVRTSAPYLINGGSAAWTESECDARGRTLKVTPPGGAGYTSYLYVGNTVKVTEPGGTRWKKFTLDGLGRLVKVTEPNPGGGEVETVYGYNIFDKLATVTMVRGGVTQTRTFT